MDTGGADDDERPFQRAPLRAHILASINPFQSSIQEGEGNGGGGGSSERSRRKRPRRRDDDPERRARRERDGSDRREGDPRLRPRVSRMRFKPRKDKESGRDETACNERRREYDDKEADRDESRDTYHRHRGDDREKDDLSASREGSGSHRHYRSRDDKDEKSDEEREKEKDGHEETGSHRQHHSHHSHHHRSHRRRKHRRSQSPSARKDGGKDGADVEEEDPYAEPPLDPDAAFRQSLFDAMADDEGAAYWEAVYGQPVHEYAQEYQRMGQTGKKGAGASAQADPDDPAAMDDDQYADYVRRRMWERSHEGIREKREQQKQSKKAQAEAQAREDARQRQRQEAFDRDRRQWAQQDRAQRQHWAEVEASLRRGAARRQRKAWAERWEAYVGRWKAWEAGPTTVERIPWPVEGPEAAEGTTRRVPKMDEAYAKEVQALFLGDRAGSEPSGAAGSGEPFADVVARLRDERVRWHPDKIQQRLGGDVDGETMKTVTAIFQVVDRLWREVRKEK